jgi:hypothetical protein
MWTLKLIGLIWEINGPCPNYSNNPHQFWGTREMLSIPLLFWYIRVPMETVKLNIHLEQKLHFAYKWSMDYTLNWQSCADKFYWSSFLVLGYYGIPAVWSI